MAFSVLGFNVWGFLKGCELGLARASGLVGCWCLGSVWACGFRAQCGFLIRALDSPPKWDPIWWWGLPHANVHPSFQVSSTGRTCPDKDLERFQMALRRV